MTAPARSRRAEILAAAEREFAATGYAGGRIERIAAAAGVNKQLLFHYYDSKEGLFSSAVGTLLSRLEPSSGGEHPADEIRAVIASIQAAVRSLPGLLAIIADSSANSEFPRQAAAVVGDWRERQRSRLRGAVLEGQRRGYFRDDIDPEAVAGVALAAALGVGALGTGGSMPPVGFLMADYCAWR